MIKTLTIDRSKWACKTNNEAREGGSWLCDKDGFKCCLGFLAVGCGASRSDIVDAATPEDSPHAIRWPKEFRTSLYANTALAGKAMSINDKEKSNSRRESRLTKLFAKAGIKLRFKGEYLKRSK